MLEVSVRFARGPGIEAEFSAPVPGVTALFGASGAGKTTLVHLIAGLLKPASGRIALGSRVFLDTQHGIAVPAEQRRLGVVFQEPRLFPHLSVLGNLCYGMRRVPRGATSLAEIAALLALEPLLARRVHTLSGGEKSRVALGRALLAQPELLLLDEPLSGLDAPRREDVLPYLERLRERALPIVYVSHQYEEVLRLATHLVLLEGGRVLASGSPAQLSLAPELRRHLPGDAVGSVIDCPVERVEAGLATVRIGPHPFTFPADVAAGTARLRVLVPARDVILALAPTPGLSVRNQLPGTVRRLEMDPGGALVTVECAQVQFLARVTHAAVAELGIRAGLALYALVKAESLRGHSYSAPADPGTRA
jgi:molybdate transport system ATP-binding protein